MNNRYDYIFDGFALFLGATQPEEILRYIQLALGVLATLLSIIFSIVNWYKKSKADGKIDSNEIKEGIEILTNGLEELKDKTQPNEKEKENKENEKL